MGKTLLWQMVVLLLSLEKDETLSSRDVASFRAFELWVYKQIGDMKGSLLSFVSKDVMTVEMSAIAKQTTLQECADSDYKESIRKRLSTLEFKVKSLESRSA